MDDIYVSIKKNYSMREENGFAIIFFNDFENTLNYFQRVPLEHFAVLKLLDGRFTKNELINLLSDTFECENSISRAAVDSILMSYSKYIEYSRELKIRNDICIEHKTTNTSNKSYASSHRLLFPLVLSLVITHKCECYCDSVKYFV